MVAAVVVLARPSRAESSPQAAGRPGFCTGRSYGFYADVSTDCKSYYICNPQLIFGKTVTRQFHYSCPPGKLFDQLHLTCVSEHKAVKSCALAEGHYGLNEAFTLRTAMLASRTTANSFSCDGRPDDSYADVRSGCRSYFVCGRIPISQSPQKAQAIGFRLSCPVPTVFDQGTGACTYPDLSVPCEDSEKLYKPRIEPDTVQAERSTPVNLSPRGDLPLLNMPDDSVFASHVGNKLLSSEVVLEGLGLERTMALHAVTASNGQPVLRAPSSNFSCDGRMYGYYADVELQCRYFHVCTVKAGVDGKRVYEKHSFVCPDEDSYFDQLEYECVWHGNASPCSEAAMHYDGNRRWND
ncbi:unnamed protein product [Ixodes hexagonus]